MAGPANGDPHRKACLLIRQSLSPDSAYVDVAVHGSGHPWLVARASRRLDARVQSEVSALARVGLDRQGEVFFMTLAPKGGGLANSGAYTRVKLPTRCTWGWPCALTMTRLLENQVFQGRVGPEEAPASGKPVLHCTLETIPVRARDRRAMYHTTEHIEAPNWSRDGQFFIFNSGGRLYRLPVGADKPERIDTGLANRCNNDHGLSPDGTRLAISDQSQ